ncbi:MAG: hypothetical protein AcusKO_34620 [Acuticoccus sp.]
MALVGDFLGTPFEAGSKAQAMAGRIKALWSAYERRRALASLRRLDALQLEDVGLTHAEIEWGLDLPFYVNAARAVSMRASQRRAAEESARRGEA